jgi:diacylglycerol kinase (ATP)
MTQAVVITNPQASRASRGLTFALARLRAGGLDVTVLPTREPGHGAELAASAIAQGAEIIIAHGGDGTIMDVAPAVAKTGRPLGLLPAGTGNRLADNLFIPWEPEAAARVILDGRTRDIDVGLMTTEAGPRYFAVAAGCGFDAEIMHRTNRKTKKTFGVGAYFASGIPIAMNMPHAMLRVECDGTVVEREGVSVIIANCGEILPSGRKFADHIHLDDGLLDVFVLDAANFAGALRVTWLLAMGRAAGDPRVSIMRGQRVTVTTEPAQAAQADGDPWGRTPLTAEVLPGALHVLAPLSA